MEIEIVNINDLVPYENNPRQNDEAVAGVKESIKEFGFKVPMVIDQNNVIVCGHTRYKASKELGLTEIPCIRANDLTDEQIKAFRLADNKVGEVAEWDFDKLNILKRHSEPFEDYFKPMLLSPAQKKARMELAFDLEDAPRPKSSPSMTST